MTSSVHVHSSLCASVSVCVLMCVRVFACVCNINLAGADSALLTLYITAPATVPPMSAVCRITAMNPPIAAPLSQLAKWGGGGEGGKAQFTVIVLYTEHARCRTGE